MYRGYQQKRLVALREARLESFSGPEIALVDALLSEMEKFSGREVSDISHDYVDCWDALPELETIPLDVVFVSKRKLTESERQYGSRLEATIGR
jgi:hypothetical protein